MNTLPGHTSPETAYLVDDYPYGFRLRCQIRYWIEYKKNHGFRFVSQTTNPKKPGTVWNKPKASTYYPVAVMVLNDDDHVTYSALNAWSAEERISAYETQHAAALTDDHRTEIRHLRALNESQKYLTYHIETRAHGDTQPGQTREEQTALFGKALNAGYRDVIAQGK